MLMNLQANRKRSERADSPRLQPPPTPPVSGEVGGGRRGVSTTHRPFQAPRFADAALIAVFLAGIVGFAALSLARPPDVQSLSRENRKPAPAPAIPRDYQSLKKTPSRIEQYFNDRIAFRESLLRWHAVVRFELGASPTEKVLIGHDGWLFMNEPKTESSTGRAPSQEMLAEAWAETFRRRGDWLAKRGIRYVVVPAPDKQAIYPEDLPDRAPIDALALRRGAIEPKTGIGRQVGIHFLAAVAESSQARARDLLSHRHALERGRGLRRLLRDPRTALETMAECKAARPRGV